MGFFWGVDQDAIVDLLKKLIFDKVRPQKPGKSSLSVLVHDRNRSGVVELVGREPWMFAKVADGMTKSCQRHAQLQDPKRIRFAAKSSAQSGDAVQIARSS